MPTSEYRIYLDNAPAGQDRLGQFGELRVDQAIGMACEAELDLALTLDDRGRWSAMEEDWTQPFRRVRIEVRVGGGDFVPLIDGPIVSQRVDLQAEPGSSRMVLVVQDDSVLLNREEAVELFEDLADSDIATRLITSGGLTPDVDSVPSAGAALQRVVVQRGTPMQLLRELARRHGMFTYVKPGPTAGQSIGVFARPRLSAASLPEILLLGRDRNVGSFTASFDALRPARAIAGSVTLSDRTAQQGRAEQATQTPLEGEATHEAVSSLATTLLSRTREEASDLDQAAGAAANRSSWAYTANVELSADSYPAVVQAYDIVRVVGAGGHLSGDYLVSRASHTLTDAAYRTRLSLLRNARSRGSDSSRGVPGGIL